MPIDRCKQAKVSAGVIRLKGDCWTTVIEQKELKREGEKEREREREKEGKGLNSDLTRGLCEV
jgi:hypothetical protein